MTDEIQKKRSPAAPRMGLEVAIQQVEVLYRKAGRSPLGADAAASALGYSGLTGSSLTLLGALNQYGLIERIKGNVQITPLAIRILKPIGEEDRLKAIQESALTPRVFFDIHENHSELSEDVLAHQLEHKGFEEDFARRVSAAYKTNCEFAKLSKIVEHENLVQKTPQNQDRNPFSIFQALEQPKPKTAPTTSELSIPVGDGRVATIPYPMSEEDFELFMGTLTLWKKKLIKPATAITQQTTHSINDE